MADLPNIDQSDRRLLAELQSDARRTNKALAAAVGLAPSTTLARIRDLEERGAIRGYHADVDPAALGRNVEALISVRLSPKTGDLVGRLVDGLLQLDAVVAVTLLTGPYDLLVHVSVADITELRALVLDHIAGFDGVVDEQTMIIFERHQKHVLPPAVT
jgi:DNA-binding Lrp family transcriptional regulator